MKTITRLSLTVTLALLALPARADVVGFSIAADYWAPEVSGDFNSTGVGTIDLSDDLDVDDPSSTSLVVRLEHPVPFLPNIRYQNIGLDSSGSNRLNRSITFEGETYNVGETVRSDFDLSHDDIVLYYEVLDNWVNLDVGLNVKTFDGEISVADSTTEATVDIDETVPLLYVAARFDLPVTGLYLGADLSSLSFEDTSLNDLTITIGYKTNTGLGLEGGIRTFSLELDDVEDVDSDLEYDGAFLHGYYRF